MNPTPSVRIALLEDNPHFARALQRLLGDAGFFVHAHYPDAAAALEIRHAATCPIDVLLCDIGLPGRDGISVLAPLKARFPSLRIIMLTSFDAPEKILRAISEGADGYVLKLSDPAELAEQIGQILRGAPPLSAAVAALVLRALRGRPVAGSGAALNVLSAREIDVLDGLRRGLSYKEIARELDIALDTVRNHIRKIYEKLGVNSARAAIARMVDVSAGRRP
jgi:DNA-binding NarL/FixJ family response regulator